MEFRLNLRNALPDVLYGNHPDIVDVLDPMHTDSADAKTE